MLVFMNSEGYSQIRSQQNTETALEPGCVQCVPFGCDVSDFVLEVGRKKAASGCNVVIISNARKVVMGCLQFAVPHLSRLGFMFVDGDLVLPGLENIMADHEQKLSAETSRPSILAERAPSKIKTVAS